MALGGQAKLRVEGLNKTFSLRKADGQVTVTQALKDVSFAVKDHEFVALIGSSGCGKTTALKIIHGLIAADAGSVYVDNRKVDRPGYDRGMVFQHSGLLPWRTTLENVEFGLELKNVPPQERRDTALRHLRLVGLDGFEHHYPHQLSGGMQQRAGLARALAIDPEILLMDEPFGALDAQTRDTLQKELLRIYQETRKTILFVTHDLDEAVYLADRVIVMASRPGRVKEEVKIELPRPRADKLLIQGEKEYLDKRLYIWQSLQAGLPRG
ncbi:MAG: ABC transporter ATP-binding protein [Deltaproteobacteria bacterium]|nr:ABC transporter ATP-binding protein [Deltaproteobacteria bacterium]